MHVVWSLLSVAAATFFGTSWTFGGCPKPQAWVKEGQGQKAFQLKNRGCYDVKLCGQLPQYSGLFRSELCDNFYLSKNQGRVLATRDWTGKKWHLMHEDQPLSNLCSANISSMTLTRASAAGGPVSVERSEKPPFPNVVLMFWDVSVVPNPLEVLKRGPRKLTIKSIQLASTQQLSPGSQAIFMRDHGGAAYDKYPAFANWAPNCDTTKLSDITMGHDTGLYVRRAVMMSGNMDIGEAENVKIPHAYTMCQRISCVRNGR